MEVRDNDRVLVCDVCGRTLLLGERASVWYVHGRGATVCELCNTEAQARGWVREGAPAPLPAPEREPQPGLIARWRARRAAKKEAAAELPPPPPGTSTTLPADPRSVAERGVEVFNASHERRAISGIAKSLGAPQASVLAFSGDRPDVIVTVAWELAWYQYRIDALATRGVKLEGRGDDVEELDLRFRAWNAEVDTEGRLVLPPRSPA